MRGQVFKALTFDQRFHQLREIWVDLLSKSSRKDGKKSFDVYMWLNRATLDIIGLAGNLPSLSISSIAHSGLHVGFNHAFDSLHSPAKEKEEKKTNDIYWALRSVLALAVSPGPFFAIQLFFPMFRLIVSMFLYQKGGETNTNYPLCFTANSSLSSS